jgi:uncharacterized protein YbjT (DUF2867 family)
MTNRIVTVFGGTGFLGRRIVRHLAGQGFSARIVSRHPTLQSIGADIRDEDAVEAQIAGAYGVVNAVSLYRERGSETFDALHVRAAGRLASQARRAGVRRLIHVSGIGADPNSRSFVLYSEPRRRRAGGASRLCQRGYRSACRDVR